MIIRDDSSASQKTDSNTPNSDKDWFSQHSTPFYIAFSAILALITITCLFLLYRGPHRTCTPFKSCCRQRGRPSARLSKNHGATWGGDGVDLAPLRTPPKNPSDTRGQSSFPCGIPGKAHRVDKGLTVSSFGQPWPASVVESPGYGDPHSSSEVRRASRPTAKTSLSTYDPLIAAPQPAVQLDRLPSAPSPTSGSLTKRTTLNPPRARTTSPARSSPLRQSDTPAAEVAEAKAWRRMTTRLAVGGESGHSDLPVGQAV